MQTLVFLPLRFFLTSLLLWSWIRPCQAQDTLSFVALVDGQPLVLERIYASPDSSQQLRISRLRFYVGQVVLLQDSQEVYRFPEHYYLWDAEVPSSQQLLATLPTGLLYNRLRFQVGVDRTTNAAGVQGGALDPMHGMYWTWQSGYINFKLEGTSTLCQSRDQAFQYHIGGFQEPYCPLQELTFAVEPSTHWGIEVDVGALIKAADLSAYPRIMSPNTQALTFAALFPSIFTLR